MIRYAADGTVDRSDIGRSPVANAREFADALDAHRAVLRELVQANRDVDAVAEAHPGMYDRIQAAWEAARKVLG